MHQLKHYRLVKCIISALILSTPLIVINNSQCWAVNEITVHSLGTAKCPQFINLTNDFAKTGAMDAVEIGFWNYIAGYITGTNRSLNSQTGVKDFAGEYTPGRIMIWLRDWCSANQSASVEGALQEFIAMRFYQITGR